MEVIMLVGQRKCAYKGEYRPEILEIADELTMDVNPEWMTEKYEKYQKSNEFDSLKMAKMNIDESIINNILYPKKTPTIIGKIIQALWRTI